MCIYSMYIYIYVYITIYVYICIYIWSHTPPEPPTINLYQIYLPHGKLFSSMLCGGQRWAEKLRERPEMETND